jgi:hypothetical protein
MFALNEIDSRRRKEKGKTKSARGKHKKTIMVNTKYGTV